MRDDQQADSGVQQPRRRLAEEVHVEPVALRRGQLVTREEQEITAEDDDEAFPRHVVLDEEQDHRGIDHQPVRERVEDPAEVRLDAPAPCQVAVDLVGDTRDAEHDPRRPAVTALGGQHQDHEDRDQHQASDGQRVRKLLQSDGNGTGRHRCGKDTPVAETLSLPGFVDAHSHGFQRALRGRTGGGDFWAWRRLMLAEAERQTPESVRRGYVDVYRELRAAGYTAVGEFHYLGFDEALAAVQAPAEADIQVVLLLAAYARGGLERFRQESPDAYLRQVEDLRARGIRVGVAPHSVRACPEDWLVEIGRYAPAERPPPPLYAGEPPRENEGGPSQHRIPPDQPLQHPRLPRERPTNVHP